MIFRLSQALATRIKVGQLAAVPPADDPLTDFSAHVFNVSRARYIIVFNTATLYSTVMHARGVTEPNALITFSLRAMADEMESDGLLPAYQQRIVPGSRVVSFGKALNRSVTGSMNELIALARIVLADPDVPPADVGRVLNQNLLSMLDGPNGLPYGEPGVAFRKLIERGG